MRTSFTTTAARLGLACALWLGGAGAALAQWTSVGGSPNASTCLLLTDGTVMCQKGETSHDWRRLTPDAFGNYDSGSWSSLASLPANFGPLYYASAVLADGRVIVVGGEYNDPSGSEVNLGAIYDPLADTWTTVTAPWTSVGDSDSVVLADGRFILRHLFSSQIAQFNPGSNDFTILGATGKADGNSEEGSTLLPDGTVLVVDCGTQGGTGSEIYDPVANSWSSAGSTQVSLPDNGGMGIVPEMGAQVLRPDGTTVVFGATEHTAVYDTGTGLWTAGSDHPMVGGKQMVSADAPATLLPNGNVLAVISEFFKSPYHVYEYDGSNNFNAAADPPGNGHPSYQARTLMLPSGQVLLTNGSSTVQLYTPGGTFNNAWRPVITAGPPNVDASQTYTISGKQLNGLSQASMYGDDAQMATNYPLVRLVNHATGHVCYARTHDHSTMGVATGNTIVTTQFDSPACLESGPSDLIVVANGIPSEPIVVNGPDLTIAKTHSPFLFTQGDVGDTFTITVANSGNSATSGAVTVTDALPPSLTATAISGPGWACVLGTLTCTRADALASGASYPSIVITVNVAANAPIAVTNTAAVSGGGEAANVTGNDTTSDSVSVRQHTVTTVDPATQDYHDVVTLRATVTPAGVAGSVTFKVDGSVVGVGSYDSTTGVATFAYLVIQPSGTYTIEADFSSANVLYLDSSGTNILTVTREETTLSYTGDTVIANGGTATLSGVLLEDGVVPIGGRTVAFTLGTGGSAQTCSGVTDAGGVATCTISPVSQPLGPGLVTAVFAGDAFYLPSAASATTIVFAFLDKGGFAVGDLNAGVGTAVTFWGAQWSIVNHLSGGPAPDSFKGFAKTLSAEPPKCGITWTTSTGATSRPPNGPLPSYMGVLVPSGVQQSGATISGNSPSIVVVQTDAGYQPDPGHPGTGTVVAVYCHP